MINCYRVTVKKQNEKLTITSISLPSFFLCEGAGRDIPGNGLNCLSNSLELFH